MRPERRLPEERQWIVPTTSAAEVQARRGLRFVDERIDLVARQHHVSPVEEVVADRQAQVLAERVADVYLDFGNDREFVVLTPANVARQGQQTALSGNRRASRRQRGREAADGHHF